MRQMKRTERIARILGASLLAFFALAGCASTRTEDEVWEDKLDDAQKKMEVIETEEQDFDLPYYQSEEPGKKKKKEDKKRRNGDGSPVVVTVLPVISFSGRGVKVEVEDMLLTNASLFADAEASAGWGARFSSRGAKAEFSVTFPAGRYECLLSEKASDAAHATVSVSIGGDSYDTWPSDPPLGIWELTTRAPIYFDIAEEKDCLISVSSASPGMSLDYIQFVKME